MKPREFRTIAATWLAKLRMSSDLYAEGQASLCKTFSALPECQLSIDLAAFRGVWGTRIALPKSFKLAIFYGEVSADFRERWMWAGERAMGELEKVEGQ